MIGAEWVVIHCFLYFCSMNTSIIPFNLKDFNEIENRVLLNGKKLAYERNNIILSTLEKPSFLVIEVYQKPDYVENAWNLKDANDKIFFQSNQIFSFKRLKDDNLNIVKLLGQTDTSLGEYKLYTFYFEFVN